MSYWVNNYWVDNIWDTEYWAVVEAVIDEYIKPINYGASNPDKTIVKVCSVCGFPFQTSEMRKYDGRYYCYHNDCYHDIAGIRRKKNPRRSKT